MSITIEELLDKYQVIEYALDKIQTDINEFTLMRKDAEKEWEKQRQFCNERVENIESLSKMMMKASDNIDDRVNKALAALNQKEHGYAQSPQIEIQLKELTARMNETEDKVASLSDLLTQKVSLIQSLVAELLKRVDGEENDEIEGPANGIVDSVNEDESGPNYDEITSVSKIFDNYNNQSAIPVIVKYKKWSGDYCAVINSVNPDGTFNADAYLNGVFNRTYTNRSDSFDYRLYRSKNEQLIISDYRNRHTSVPVNETKQIKGKKKKASVKINYNEVTYISDLYDKYKNVIGADFMVKKTTWNKYHMVVSSVSQGVVKGDLYWDDGKHYQKKTLTDEPKYHMWNNGETIHF